MRVETEINNKKILIVAGFDSDGNCYSDIYSYDCTEYPELMHSQINTGHASNIKNDNDLIKAVINAGVK